MRKVSRIRLRARAFCALLLVIGLFPAVSPAQMKKPNFVLTMTDDVGCGDLGSYGGGAMRDPQAPTDCSCFRRPPNSLLGILSLSVSTASPVFADRGNYHLERISKNTLQPSTDIRGGGANVTFF